MKAIRAFFSRLFRSLMEPPVTQDSLAACYAAMGDAQLRGVDRSQLTPEARALWQAEVDRRDTAARGGKRSA